MGAELASPVTILVREPGRVTAGGGEPLVRSRGVKKLLQRVAHRAGHKRAQIPCLYLLRPAVAGVKRPILRAGGKSVPRTEGCLYLSHALRRHLSCASSGALLRVCYSPLLAGAALPEAAGG